MLNFIKSAFNKADKGSTQEKHKIILNVYDMLQPGFITNVGFVLGIGIYHSGVEIGGNEYCFGGHDYDNVTGVFIVKPKVGPQGLLFKQSINMGYTELTQEQIDKVLQDISREFLGTTYKLLTRNCNHFSDELCRRLTGKSAPGWINRAAKLGTMFPCVIPTEWVEPPDAQENASNTPLQQQQQQQQSPHGVTIDTSMKKKKKSSSSPTRPTSSSMDSIRLVRTPVLEDDEIDCSSPVKEPDTRRPDVIRSATQLSITAPVEL